MEFETDVLGAPYQARTIPLANDEEGAVVATLVRRTAPEPNGTAVLHVHGYCDYFFQTDLADWWVAQGFDFYALDLRKYGRSLREHQTPNFVAELATYDEELNAALELIPNRHLILSAHSTGGLILPLWADRHPSDRLVGMALNSPWFDLRGPLALRTAGTHLIKEVGKRQPMRAIPRPTNTWYGESLHRDYDGEWDYNLEWKPLGSFPIYAGWLRTVRNGHARLHEGLTLPFPAIVMTSTRTGAPTQLSEEVHTTDVVLDIHQIRHWAPSLGTPHLTLVSIPDAKHDISLSAEPVRARMKAELARWLPVVAQYAAAGE